MRRVAAIYTRGLNPPYTEGYVAMGLSIAQSLKFCNWEPLILNFNYSSQANVDSRLPIKEINVKVPAIDRASIIHHPTTTLQLLAASFEFTLLPILFARELRAKALLVHLVNCFKFPRAFLRLINRTPVIAHVCQTPSMTYDLEGRLPVSVNAFVASSNKICKVLHSLHPNGAPIFTIPPSVDPAFFENRNIARHNNVLYIGNLSPTRVPDKFFPAVKEILEADSDAFFRFIAPNTPSNFIRAAEIMKLCRSLKIERRVSVSVRNMNDTEKLREYSEAKLFVFPSMRECGDVIEPPLTVLEALASGVPVLATKTYSVDEAITDGENGRLVGVKDYPRLADEAIDLLRAEPVKWRSWSMRARKVASENFSIPAIARRQAAMHASLIGD